MIENSLERIRRQSAMFDALDAITMQSPTLTHHAQKLYAHHPPSGEHVVGTTMAAIDSAIRLGHDPLFIGYLAFGHDCGKKDVLQWALNGGGLRSISRMLVRQRHMKATRDYLRAMPASEVTPYTPHSIMAGSMGHHDLWPNRHWFDRYPRRGIHWPKIGRERRASLTREELTGLAILTLSDRANRIHHGYNGNGDGANVRPALQQMIASSRIPISRQVLNTYADAVMNATMSMTPGLMQEAMRIVGIRTQS